MHALKFKIGDVIRHAEFGDYIITEYRKEGYGVINRVDFCDGLIYYNNEKEWSLIESSNKLCALSKPSNVGLCPRCGGELKDHMSIGLGEMIKKCSNDSCGWC